MANYVPLNEGVAAAGGHLVPPEYGEILFTGINRQSAVAQVAKLESTTTKERIYPIYVGRPTASFVAEGAAKPATGAEFSSLAIHIKKIVSVPVFTEELIEDAMTDPGLLLSPDVAGAMADLTDAHAIGYANGTAVASPQFDATWAGTTQEVTYSLAGKGDKLALAVSGGMAKIEGNGYRPTAIVLSTAFRAVLRDARGSGDNDTSPVFTDGFGREPDTLYGLPIVYTTNLQAPTTANNITGFVVDGQNSVLLSRKDVNVRVHDSGTIGGHNLLEENKVAHIWEARRGFGVHDLNRSVCKIKVVA